MKHIKTIIFGGALALLAVAMLGSFALHANTAHAATADAATADAATVSNPLLTADNCSVSSLDIAQIALVENDPALSYSQEIAQELALRQKLVGQTIACSEKEVQTLQSALNAAPVDADSQALQTQFSGRLDDATNFYNLELGKLNGSGISGTEAVAKEVLAWREGTFEPLADEISNFILWSENQSLFSTAQTRMDETNRAVSFLESAASNADLQTAFNTALADFTTAQSQNAQAKSDLAQGLPANDSLTLIKQSLDSLASTYQDFSNVSTLIKGILPQ